MAAKRPSLDSIFGGKDERPPLDTIFAERAPEQMAVEAPKSRGLLGNLADLGKSALGLVGEGLEAVDRTTSLPVRKSIAAAERAAGAQVPENPTPRDIVKPLGLSTKTMSERFPGAYADPEKPDVTLIPEVLGVNLRPTKGGLLDFSPEDLAAGAAGIATDALTYVPVGKVAGLLKRGGGAVADTAVKVGNNVAFSVPREVSERYLKNPEIVRESKGLMGARERVAEVTNKVKGDATELSRVAADARSGAAPTIQKAQVLEIYDRKLADETLTASERQALAARRAEVEKLPDVITDNQLYREIRELDELADFDTPIPSKAKGLINQTRGEARGLLGRANPAFDASQKEVAKRIGIRDRLVEKFGLTRNEAGKLVPSDRTTQALKDLARGDKKDRAALLEDLKELGYDDLKPELQAALDKALFASTNAQGSRRTNAGAIIGSILGTMMGGVPGGGAGGLIGTAAGAAADRYAGPMAQRVLDARLAAGKGASKAVDAVASRPNIAKGVPLGAAASEKSREDERRRRK